MDRRGFEENIVELSNCLVEAMETHFKKRGFSFDQKRFRENSSVNFDCFVREATLIGAEVPLRD